MRVRRKYEDTRIGKTLGSSSSSLSLEKRTWRWRRSLNLGWIQVVKVLKLMKAQAKIDVEMLKVPTCKLSMQLIIGKICKFCSYSIHVRSHSATNFSSSKTTSPNSKGAFVLSRLNILIGRLHCRAWFCIHTNLTPNEFATWVLTVPYTFCSFPMVYQGQERIFTLGMLVF